MKVTVLEHPRIRSAEHFNDIANTPLWSCLMGGYTASALRHAGHDVAFVDATEIGLNFKETEELIESQATALLCINAVYFWEHTGRLFDMLENLRTDGFKGHINLIGFFPSLAYKEILKGSTAVDSIIAGECEDSIVSLANMLESGEDISVVPGVITRNRSTLKTSHCKKVSDDPDRFQFPEREAGNKSRTASILASRGCYNHCAFCLVPPFYGNGPMWKGRSPENIVQEMEGLIAKGYRDFYFIDPNFIGPGKRGRERTERLMDMIEPMDITFGMETRPNDLDPAIFDKLVRGGLTSLLMGIESGSKTILDGLNKGGNINVSEKAIKICREFGIEPEIGFLMFVPDATLKDLEYNFDFLIRNNLLDRLDRTANLLGHRQIVMNGTPGFRLYEEQNRLKRKGVLGFEGDVIYSDERVKLISDAMIFACLLVLGNMEDSDSSIFWKKKGEDECYEYITSKLNDYLVQFFVELMVAVRENISFFIEKKYEEKIRENIVTIIG